MPESIPVATGHLAVSCPWEVFPWGPLSPPWSRKVEVMFSDGLKLYSVRGFTSISVHRLSLGLGSLSCKIRLKYIYILESSFVVKTIRVYFS